MVNESHLKLLLDTLYFTRNSKFYYLKSVLWKNIVQYLIRFMYLFCPKISKNDSRKPFIKKLLGSIFYALSFSVHNVASHFYDLILAWGDCC